MSAENKPFNKTHGKQICLTLDLEQDYGRIEEYSAFKLIPKLIELFKKYNLKLTIFTTAKIIEEKPKVIKLFQDNLECDFAIHSYDHEINKKISSEQRKENIKKAVDIYKKRFNKNPEGYRAPSGDLKSDEIGWLKEENFLYSSSFITTFRPGKFNNLMKSDKIFTHPNGLLEIPFSSLPFIKLPYSLGYFKILGWPLVKTLVKMKKSQDPIIFGFHLHDLVKLGNLDKLKKTKPGYRLFYLRNKHNGFKILEKFIKTMKENNYQSITMRELTKQVLSDKLVK